MPLHPLLEELNTMQRQAVTAPRKPLLLLAGPGTGKTRTLTARIIYEIDFYKLDPAQILALTFSNKAAKEIKHRLMIALKHKAEKIRVSTFHAFCLDVLRKYHQTAGLGKNFSVCDDEYQKRLLKKLIIHRIRENVDKKINGVLLAFSNYMLKQKSLPLFSANIYDRYVAHLQKHNLIDYNQILVKTLKLFRENEDILNQYRFLNQSILVDEFQDTDPVQYEIVKLLAEKHQNIFVVADDDQSIYAWRGANPENIRQFIKDFNIKEPILLEQNYRCGYAIMDTAQRVVKNTDRVHPEKIIHSNPANQAAVQALFFSDENQEINFIIKKITDWTNNHSVNYADIAVIYPQHRFGERLAANLLKERIPHQQARGRNLIDQPEMQKVILYLKLIRDPSDELILEELVETELGYHILKQIQELQNIRSGTFRQALNEFSQRETLSLNIKNQLATFIGNIANLVNLKSFFTFNRLIEEIIKSTRDLNESVLQKYLAAIEPFSTEKFKHLNKPNSKIWVYHSNEALSFIAAGLLERAFDNEIHIWQKDSAMHVSANDLLILLDPVPVETLGCTYHTLFRQKSNRREGTLSILFRWLQWHLKQEGEKVFKDYVVFDLETTGANPDYCGIVEIAAIRIRNGAIEDEFSSLVNPGIPIEPGAQDVHQISENDIKDAPRTAEIWEKFLNFIGSDLLIAHNGFAFDFKILDRINRELGYTKNKNLRYDSLILARNMYPDKKNSIDGLMERFRLTAEKRHRALDDVKILHEIFQKLLINMNERELKSSAEELTEYVALGNWTENKLSAAEDKIYFSAGIRKLVSPYSIIRKRYAEHFNTDDATLTQKLINSIQHQNQMVQFYDTSDDFIHKILAVANDFNHMPIDQAIAEFLSFISLINPQDALEHIEAVSLLTYHSAKGLEFDRVIIMGMEDESMPSFFAYKTDEDDRPVYRKLEEQKRLLYVGITRAKSEVIFTAVKNRFGRSQRSSPFLDELKEAININKYA